MTGGTHETAPTTRSRWVDLAFRARNMLQAAARQGWMRFVGLAILLGGAGWSIAHLDLELGQLSFGLLALNLVVLSPLKLFVAAHATGPAHESGDIDAVAGNVRNASSGAVAQWRDWTDPLVAAVAHSCDAGMRVHGYGVEPEWQERTARAGVP